MQVSCLGAVIGICTWGWERISPLKSIFLLLLLGSMLSIIDIILSSHCLFLSFVWVHKRICCLVICISYQFLPIWDFNQPAWIIHSWLKSLRWRCQRWLGGCHSPTLEFVASRDIIISRVRMRNSYANLALWLPPRLGRHAASSARWILATCWEYSSLRRVHAPNSLVWYTRRICWMMPMSSWVKSDCVAYRHTRKAAVESPSASFGLHFLHGLSDDVMVQVIPKILFL